jgi:hypothetical protein
MSLGLGLFLDRLIDRHSWVLAVAAGLICVLEQGITTPSYSKGAQRAVVEAMAARIPRDCEAFFYSPRGLAVPPQQCQVDAMWAGLKRRIPTVNGYSGNAPPGWALGEAEVPTVAHEARVSETLAGWLRARNVPKERVAWIKGER